MKRVDLRDSEVDGHFLPGEEEHRRFEELLGLAGVLGLLKQFRRQEDGFGEYRMTRWRRVLKKEVFIGQREQGHF